MTQSEFLSQYEIIKKRIKLNREYILKAEREAVECGSRKLYEAVSRYQDLLYEENERLIAKKFAIELAIERCPCSETEREVMYRRYILSEKWSEISDAMMYSIQHLHRLNNKALKKVVIPLYA